VIPLAVAALAILAAPAPARALEVAGRCSVTFFATSTVHDFEGSAPCALLQIEQIEKHDGPVHYRARAEVAVEALDTGIDARNRRMREMFEAQRYPKIAAVFADVQPEQVRGSTGLLAFDLTIHGVTRRIGATTSDWSEVPSHQSARFRAAFDLSLSEFGLEAPVAIGFVRVADRVRVAVDVDLTAR
jgi:polyisoprenoid-binding protein YceI